MDVNGVTAFLTCIYLITKEMELSLHLWVIRMSSVKCVFVCPYVYWVVDLFFWCIGTLYILCIAALCYLYSWVWHERLEGLILPVFLSESTILAMLTFLCSDQAPPPQFPVLNLPPTIKGHLSYSRSLNISNTLLH